MGIGWDCTVNLEQSSLILRIADLHSFLTLASGILLQLARITTLKFIRTLTCELRICFKKKRLNEFRALAGKKKIVLLLDLGNKTQLWFWAHFFGYFL